MKTCSFCGSELSEDAIICKVCARIVPYKTHYSPADVVPPELSIPDNKRIKRVIHANLFKFGVFLVFFICLVWLANLGMAALSDNHIQHNNWSSKLALSAITIDRFSSDTEITVTGKVANIAGRNMQNVVIRAYALNTLSQQVGEAYFEVEPGVLLPDSAADFLITIPVDMDLVHRVKVEIFDAQVQPEIIRPIKWSRVWGSKG
jgi:hypothetical protein